MGSYRNLALATAILVSTGDPDVIPRYTNGRNAKADNRISRRRAEKRAERKHARDARKRNRRG